MQGVIPLLAASDDWKVPTQIRMGDGVQGMIPLLAANDARNLPRRLSMGVWHPTCDTLAEMMLAAHPQLATNTCARQALAWHAYLLEQIAKRQSGCTSGQVRDDHAVNLSSL